MKAKILSILTDFAEQRISAKDFADIFYKENDQFETIIKGDASDEFNKGTFYNLIELDFNSQEKRALYLVKEYLRYNKIELPPDDKKIKLVEKKLGHALPTSYVNFMKNYDAQHFGDHSVIPVTEPIPKNLKYYLGSGFLEFNSIFKISPDENDHESILHGKSLAAEWQLPNDVIPLEGDGHTWVAFDYRDNKSEPTIIFIESDDCLTFKLANNFLELLEKLLPYDSVFDEDGNIIYGRSE